MKITVPYPPSANKYWRTVNGHPVVSKEARLYKQGVKMRALTEGFRKPLSGPVVLSMVVYRPIRRGDLSNRLKILEDALSGVFYDDDEQVVEIHMRREDDKENPRVEVRVEPEKGT